MDTGELRDKISNMPTDKELYRKFCVTLCDIEYSLLHECWDKTLETVRNFYEVYNDLYHEED